MRKKYHMFFQPSIVIIIGHPGADHGARSSAPNIRAIVAGLAEGAYGTVDVHAAVSPLSNPSAKSTSETSPEAVAMGTGGARL